MFYGRDTNELIIKGAIVGMHPNRNTPCINGCGLCIHSHVKQLLAHSVTNLAIQSALRLAATLNALVTAYGCADDNRNLEI
jgi:hypothetical protein